MQEGGGTADRGLFFYYNNVSCGTLDWFEPFDTMVFIFGAIGGRGGKFDYRFFFIDDWFLRCSDLWFVSYCCNLLADIFK
jgi:hypothetical protein